MAPDPADVARAATAWTWMPPGGREVVTEEYHFMRFPAWFDHQQIVGFRPRRDPAVVAREVLGLARATGLPDVEWWVAPDAPDHDVALVTGLGGELSLTLDVLALDLAGGAPPPASAPTGIEVRLVGDVAGQRDHHRVAAAVFGEPMPPEDEIEVDHERLGRTVVAYADGAPVGAAGVTVVDGVARLWSGCVLTAFRRRGIYRALLDARLAVAVRHGARMALVRGDVETSAPLLRGAGFASYGTTRAFRVPLA